MRSAVVAALAVASAIASGACGSTDLQPIHDPGSDAALASAGDDAVTAARDAAAPGAGRCKRGMAANDAPSAVLEPTDSSAGLSWWYNWTNQPPAGGAPIEFVPMLWGGGSLGASIPAGSKYLLGFNEPNFNSQANLTTHQAASDWPSVEAKAAPLGLAIVAPGVNFCGTTGDASPSDSSQCTEPTVTDPYTYIRDFLAACSGCKVDYIAAHWFNCDLPSLRAYLDGDGTDGGLQGFAQFGKPIWLTEFSCDPSHTAAEQKAYMQAAVPYLESNANVMRYAWFNAKNIPSAQLTNSDGSLTALGTTYVGLAQNCP
jgi:Glycosyl hydrolase catalytic core